MPGDNTPSDGRGIDSENGLVGPRRVADSGCVDDPEAVYDTPFQLGEFVVDRETVRNYGGEPRATDDTGVAVAVREGRALAADMYLDSGQSIADVNPEYPPDDPVVEVAFVETLDKMFPKWRAEWERWQLDWRLDEFKKEWGVPIQVYGYPASRLQLADEVAGVDTDIMADEGEA